MPQVKAMTTGSKVDEAQVLPEFSLGETQPVAVPLPKQKRAMQDGRAGARDYTQRVDGGVAAIAAGRAAIDHWGARLEALRDGTGAAAPRFTARVLDEFDRYSQEALAGIAEPEGRASLAPRLARLRVAVARKAVVHETAMRQVQRSEQVSETLGTLQTAVAHGLLSFEEAGGELSATLDEAESLWMPPDAAGAWRRAGAVALAEADVRRRIAWDARTATDELQRAIGNADGKGAVGPALAALPQERLEVLLRVSQDEAKHADANRQRAGETALRVDAEEQALEQSGASAQLDGLIDDGLAGDAEADVVLSKALITSFRHGGALARARARRSQEGRRVHAVATVGTAIAAGLPLDPHDAADRAAVDAHFETVERHLGEGQADRRLEEHADLVRSYGMLPTRLRRFVETQLGAGTADQRRRSAAWVLRLHHKTPEATADLSDDTIALATRLSGLQAADIDAERSASLADAMIAEPDEETRGVRRDRYRAGTLPDRAADWLEGRYPTASRLLGFADAAAQWSKTVERLFARYGDFDAAIETAWRRFYRVWAPTSIGPQRWQQYAPEAAYRVNDPNDPDQMWIGEQLLECWPACSGKPTPLIGQVLLQPAFVPGKRRPVYAVHPAYGPDGKRVAGTGTLIFVPDWMRSPAGRTALSEAPNLSLARQTLPRDPQHQSLVR